VRRRLFLGACAASAVLASAQATGARDLRARLYARTRLVDTAMQPLAAARLAAGRNYVFHYPYQGTPCFLIELGRETGRDVRLRTEDRRPYEWPGGVGPRRSIVAYSAICTHRLTYPTPQISFISFRPRSTAGRAARPETIHCCSEHSQYDPAAGARVVGGPAPQPLCAILLEHDPATDGLYALGTLGGEMFDTFFSKFESKLELDYGGRRARQRTGERAIVMDLESFSRQQVRC
jgi:arsenite oxidase small subunit